MSFRDLIPTREELVEMWGSFFENAERRLEAQQFLMSRLNEGALASGEEYAGGIMGARRWTVRDDITKDVAPRAGLRKFIYAIKDRVEQALIYMRVLVIVIRREGRNDIVVTPKGYTGVVARADGTLNPEAFYSKGVRLPVWRPLSNWNEKKNQWENWVGSDLDKEAAIQKRLGQVAKGSAWFLDERFPQTSEASWLQVTMDEETAKDCGIPFTCVVFVPWPVLIGIAAILKFAKMTKEGLRDMILNLSLEMGDILKLVPEIGPALGAIADTEMIYRYIGLMLVREFAPKGAPTYREVYRMFDYTQFLADEREFERSGGRSKRNPFFALRMIRDYEFEMADGTRQKVVVTQLYNSDGAPRKSGKAGDGEGQIDIYLLTSPLDHPFIPGKKREVVLDPEQGFIFLLTKFIWLMGWGDFSAHKDFKAVGHFKKDVMNCFKSIVSEIDDRRIERAAGEADQTAQNLYKIVCKMYDADGKQKAWDHLVTWERWGGTLEFGDEEKAKYEQAWYDFCSSWAEREMIALAARGNLAHADIQKEAWLWSHRIRKMRIPDPINMGGFTVSVDDSERFAMLSRFDPSHPGDILRNGVHAAVDAGIIRRFQRLMRLGEFGRSTVMAAIKSDKFGVATVGGRALLYTAQVGRWDEVDEKVAKRMFNGEVTPRDSRYHHYQTYPVLVDERGDAVGGLQQVVFGLSRYRFIWKARPIGPWRKREVSLKDAILQRQESLSRLDREGHGESVYIVAGPPLWPLWLALGDAADEENAAKMMCAGDARSLGSTTSLINGGYARGITNPEIEMQRIENMIAAPWYNKMGDNLIFRARGNMAMSVSETDYIESNAKAYGGGGLHPMFDYGSNWEEVLTRHEMREELKRAQIMVWSIYTKCWGPELPWQIQARTVGQLDYYSEFVTHGDFDPTEE